MSFQGVCQICEAAPAHHTCTQCGRNVCDEHFDRELHVCGRCAATIRQTVTDRPGGDPSFLR